MDELLGLVVVLDSEGVKVLRASDLELGDGAVLLDGGGLDVLSSGEFNEVLDVLNFDLSSQLALLLIIDFTHPDWYLQALLLYFGVGSEKLAVVEI